jgi:hypothetical protein
MRKKIEWQWEKLDNNTLRAKVIGGWLVNYMVTIDNEKGKDIGISQSMQFVADRDHEWVIAAPFDPSVTSAAKPKVNADDFASPSK